MKSIDVTDSTIREEVTTTTIKYIRQKRKNSQNNFQLDKMSKKKFFSKNKVNQKFIQIGKVKLINNENKNNRKKRRNSNKTKRKRYKKFTLEFNN